MNQAEGECARSCMGEWFGWISGRVLHEVKILELGLELGSSWVCGVSALVLVDGEF